MDDGQEEYREAADRETRGLPTPLPVAIAQTVAMVLLAAVVAALIASGRF
ncbi:hypothetical protein OG455_39265 [Kitasatospora sp. NBC_01287]|nr:hypothetical protein [Kitasatospora sp. NBC_01287]MCX4751477.1 hypothetical protein [Kitasatospora sp. NBC_01287]